MLAQSLRDPCAEVRVLSLQGLGNILFHPEKVRGAARLRCRRGPLGWHRALSLPAVWLGHATSPLRGSVSSPVEWSRCRPLGRAAGGCGIHSPRRPAGGTPRQAHRGELPFLPLNTNLTNWALARILGDPHVATCKSPKPTSPSPRQKCVSLQPRGRPILQPLGAGSWFAAPHPGCRPSLRGPGRPPPRPLQPAGTTTHGSRASAPGQLAKRSQQHRKGGKVHPSGLPEARPQSGLLAKEQGLTSAGPPHPLPLLTSEEGTPTTRSKVLSPHCRLTVPDLTLFSGMAPWPFRPR